LGAAHRTEENGVARQRQLHHLVGQGGAAAVVGGAADETLFHHEPDAGAFGHNAEDLQGLFDNLRPDPVAGEDRDAILPHFAFLIAM
jgi:hypothetical protein